MYAIWSLNGFAKTRRLSYGTFDDIATAVKAIEAHPGLICWDADEEHDAADVFTASGEVFAIERVSP
jgi:hypothetical protein